jgi:hypothetical protein
MMMKKKKYSRECFLHPHHAVENLILYHSVAEIFHAGAKKRARAKPAAPGLPVPGSRERSAENKVWYEHRRTHVLAKILLRRKAAVKRGV